MSLNGDLATKGGKIMSNIKICSGCGKEFTGVNYYADFQPLCKECHDDMESKLDEMEVPMADID